MEKKQADKLLKLAETNPELAGKIADCISSDNAKSAKDFNELSSSEDNRITITDEQKKWAKRLVWVLVVGVVCIISLFISFALSIHSGHSPAGSFILLAITMIITIVLYWLCAIKAGLPTAKAVLGKYFKFG